MLSFSQDLILSDLEVLEWQAYFVEAIGSYQVVTSAPSEGSNMVALVVVPGLALLARCLHGFLRGFLSGDAALPPLSTTAARLALVHSGSLPHCTYGAHFC